MSVLQEAVMVGNRWTQPVNPVKEKMLTCATRQKKMGTMQIWITHQLAEI